MASKKMNILKNVFEYVSKFFKICFEWFVGFCGIFGILGLLWVIGQTVIVFKANYNNGIIESLMAIAILIGIFTFFIYVSIEYIIPAGKDFIKIITEKMKK